jgi:SAM-dependent methyltransferase
MGARAVQLGEQGCHATGIDIAPWRIGYARARAAQNNVLVNFVIGDVERPCFRQESFDLVFCGAILHHLPDVEGSLSNLHQVLRDGGVLIAVEPGLLNPFAWVRRTFFPTPVHTPDEHPFVPYLFVRRLRRHFDHVEYQYFNILSFAALIVQKLFGDRAGDFSYRVLSSLDGVLTTIPIVNQLSKSICVVARKGSPSPDGSPQGRPAR